MSTVVANSISGKELFLFGDTIVTKVGDKAAVPGVTSHGEIYVPMTTQSGEPIGFSESACKVGVLSQNAIIGMAGDADFGFSILDFIYSYPNNLESLMGIREIFISAAKMLSPSKFSIGTNVEFLFCIKDSGYHICVGKFTVKSEGILDFWFDGKLITIEKVHQYMLGAGREYLRKYLPQDILESCHIDPSLIDVAIQMMWMDYSRKLRKETGNQAVSVGGAFLGFGIDHSGLKFPKDTLFISADKKSVVEYMTKIVYRNGLFIITDFINNSVNVVRTIDEEVKFRKEKPQENLNIHNLLVDNVGLFAQVSLVSYFAEGEDQPHTNIVESDENQNCLMGSAPEKGFVWVQPEQEMTFKFQNDQVIKLKIPRLHPFSQKKTVE